MNVTYIFQGFYLDFKLLFIVLFIGIISWKGASGFNGGVIFQMRRASFLSGGGAPHGGGSKKIAGWGAMTTPPPLTMGNPVIGLQMH